MKVGVEELSPEKLSPLLQAEIQQRDRGRGRGLGSRKRSAEHSPIFSSTFTLRPIARSLRRFVRAAPFSRSSATAFATMSTDKLSMSWPIWQRGVVRRTA